MHIFPIHESYLFHCLFSTICPPIVAGAAEGLGYAVHGLALHDCDSLVLEAVRVYPWAYAEQQASGTVLDAFCQRASAPREERRGRRPACQYRPPLSLTDGGAPPPSSG